VVLAECMGRHAVPCWQLPEARMQHLQPGM
jgi:hypothetical protein